MGFVHCHRIVSKIYGGMRHDKQKIIDYERYVTGELRLKQGRFGMNILSGAESGLSQKHWRDEGLKKEPNLDPLICHHIVEGKNIPFIGRKSPPSGALGNGPLPPFKLLCIVSYVPG